jgi:dipeptidyl aminopeptidase/acylaminoacyl peptidase
VGVREPRFGQVTMLSPTLWRVWTMAEDGSDRRTVREFDRRIWRARWSPDGRRIAFWDQSVEDAYMHRLYVMDADGTNMRFLAWGDSMGGLNWHPGSRHLVYTRYTVVRPNPASTVTMTDGFFHVVDADTGASAFSASAGMSGVYTAGCACTASRVTAPFWRDATSVVYNAFEQVMYDPANPATLNASSFRVRSMPVPTLPALDVPFSAVGRLGDDIASQDTLIQVRPAVGVLFKQVLPSGVQRMLLVPPSGGQRVVLADGASRFYGLSPDGTRCIWNERFHMWAGFDGISTATALGPYPLEGEDWYLAA